MDPTLPPGEDIEQLIQEANTALLDGEDRDSIVDRFMKRGIDDEVVCALVDICVPPFEVGGGDPEIYGTAYKVMGVTIHFEKDASFVRKERRAARRQRQERIIRKLLRDKLGTNPELDFGPTFATETQSTKFATATVDPSSSSCSHATVAWHHRLFGGCVADFAVEAGTRTVASCYIQLPHGWLVVILLMPVAPQLSRSPDAGVDARVGMADIPSTARARTGASCSGSSNGLRFRARSADTLRIASAALHDLR